MRVFISYKREDQPFAETLRDKLQSWGLETWLDIDNIRADKDWDTAIDNGLKSSQILIGVMTTQSLVSSNVIAEWAWAKANKRRLMIVWLRDVLEEDVPHQFIQHQRIDFRKDQTRGFAKLRRELSEVAAIAPASSEPTRVLNPSDQYGAFNLEVNPKDDNRAIMLRKIYKNWVVGVLDNILNEARPFKIGIDLTSRGAVLKELDLDDIELENTDDIWRIFNDMRRELLILGAPGAGKTVLLLQLARELLIEAQNNDKKPIPVVLNLSSWVAMRDKPFGEWIARRLYIEYQVPKKLAEQWATTEKLLLLLDGLDEIGSGIDRDADNPDDLSTQHRNDCVAAINEYRQKYQSVRVVICSRIKEYVALSEKFNLRAAIQLTPLSDAQIEQYLAVDDLAGLRNIVENEPKLKELAKTPFLLNTMAYAYHTFSPIELRVEKNISRKHDIFKQYIDRRLVEDKETTYDTAQTRRYLNWLSWQSRYHAQTIFHVESIQPFWLLPYYRGSYWLLGGLTFGLGVWLSEGLLLALIVWLIYGLSLGWGLIIGLSLGLFDGLIAGLILIESDITPAETLRLEIYSEKLMFGLQVGLMLGLITGVIFWLLGGLSFGIVVLVVMLVVVLGGIRVAQNDELGLRGGRGVMLVPRSNISERTQPNQAIKASFQKSLFGGLIMSLLSGLVVGLLSGLIMIGLLSGILFGLIFTLRYGGGMIVLQHIVLRFVLTRAGYAPFNYTRFLDYCAERKLLRKVGGGYIFIHRELLDYCAEQWDIKHPNFAKQAPHK